MLPKTIPVLVGGQETPTKASEPIQLSAFEMSVAMSRADRHIRTLISQQLKPLKLSLMQWLVLGTVVITTEESIAMGAVAQLLGISLSQVTSLSNYLLDMRMLRQKTDRTDHRSRRLQATTRGRAIHYDAESAINVALQQWLQPIPANYLVFYNRVLQTMAELKIAKT